jgi:DNA-directed RNA polymerase subunit RPC12/RpoP
MDVIFHCPHCRQELEVDSAAAGQEISCPSCARNITIPSATHATHVAAPIPPPPPSASAGEAAKKAAAEKAFSVPVSNRPVEPLIQKALPPLEAATKDAGVRLRIKTIRHSDCREVGHDHFDQTVSEFLNKIGETAIVSITTVNYSYIEIGSQKLVTDFGVLVVYRG